MSSPPSQLCLVSRVLEKIPPQTLYHWEPSAPVVSALTPQPQPSFIYININFSIIAGKADLTRYREAGAEVISVLCQFAKTVERASVDEAYVDLTDEVNDMTKSSQRVTLDDLPSTHIVGAAEGISYQLYLPNTPLSACFPHSCLRLTYTLSP